MQDTTQRVAGNQHLTTDLLTPRDVQDELRIGERLTYRLLRRGEIPSTRVGYLYRIRRRDLEYYLAANAKAS
jgi:excisionase family DNA binding protein